MVRRVPLSTDMSTAGQAPVFAAGEGADQSRLPAASPKSRSLSGRAGANDASVRPTMWNP
jgi:hypothetical protein